MCEKCVASEDRQDGKKEHPCCLSEKEHNELLSFHAMAVSDIAFFKQQQWKTAYYGLLLYAAVIAITAQNFEDISGEFGLFVLNLLLWLTNITVLAAGIWLLHEQEISLRKGRNRLSNIRERFSKISCAALDEKGDPSKALMSAAERPSLQTFLSLVFFLGWAITCLMLWKAWHAQ